ncbi:hypothetical protein [Streptomyces coacervatus]|uniref:Uncharacterized protein n=1 Tax=Streptomyces coacervatus TaxID=647381 RepID=A0ABP7HPC0_9ACTN|nr:hypothetical protein [Streptomyces coacervatus]MDF2270873.1 hypothetical protein [Streptomyces coacervatus]
MRTGRDQRDLTTEVRFSFGTFVPSAYRAGAASRFGGTLPQFRKRFEREAGALDRVQGAHMVRLLDSGCDDDLVWVATE